MDAETLDLWSDALLLKIHAITGWAIPEKTILKVFKDQFYKKLLESYPTCNPDEVEYAFRNYGTQVKDWGKSMNLSLIDEVMIPYLERRLTLSRMEEQKKLPMTNNTEDIDNDQLWDATEALIKKGGGIYLIPDCLYAWMEKNGNILITKEEKLKYWERACLATHSEIVNDFESNPNNNTRDMLSRFNKVRETRAWDSEPVIKTRVQNLAKKMVVFQMMKC